MAKDSNKNDSKGGAQKEQAVRHCDLCDAVVQQGKGIVITQSTGDSVLCSKACAAEWAMWMGGNEKEKQ